MKTGISDERLHDLWNHVDIDEMTPATRKRTFYDLISDLANARTQIAELNQSVDTWADERNKWMEIAQRRTEQLQSHESVVRLLRHIRDVLYEFDFDVSVIDSEVWDSVDKTLSAIDTANVENGVPAVICWDHQQGKAIIQQFEDNWLAEEATTTNNQNPELIGE